MVDAADPEISDGLGPHMGHLSNRVDLERIGWWWSD